MTITKFDGLTTKEIKALPLEEKVELFRALLMNLDNPNELDILNVFRLVNSYNVFDEEFFEREESYLNDICEFIDVKTELEAEVEEFITDLVTWYLSIIASCEIPLTIEQDDTKQKVPATIYGILVLGSMPLMASLMGKIDLDNIDMANLFKVKEGFSVLSRLFANHAMVGEYLEKI